MLIPNLPVSLPVLMTTICLTEELTLSISTHAAHSYKKMLYFRVCASGEPCVFPDWPCILELEPRPDTEKAESLGNLHEADRDPECVDKASCFLSVMRGCPKLSSPFIFSLLVK